MNKKIAVIGQGFVGGSLSTTFEERGFKVIRYSLEKEFIINKQEVRNADIVFIAVPTPTSPNGFDLSIVRETLSLVGKGKIAVIKSTMLPGSTNKLQKEYPDIKIVHSPEFLTEVSCLQDSRKPDRNIIGYTKKSFSSTGDIMELFPPAPTEKIIRAEEAEMVKYGGNCWFYFKVLYINILFELCQMTKVDYEVVKEAMAADPRIGRTHLDPVHQGGRGAGGHCFIKDFAAFRRLFIESIQAKDISDDLLLAMVEFLNAAEQLNICLLKTTNKSKRILREVYG